MNTDPHGATRRGTSDGPVHVLHIDDDAAWTGLVVSWLSRRGLKVLALGSAVEMRSYLSRCTRLPLCILLDLTLKDGDGLDLCDEIKRSPSFQHLPIVILSGRPMTAQECLKHQALYRVQKDPGAEEELAAALESILAQRERTQGVIDAGDLRLDPRSRVVSLAGEPVALLHPGPFSALMLLVQSAPRPVNEARLYGAFLERAPHNTADPELSARSTVRNYISRLRGSLGEVLAARITFIHGEGYVYRP